MDNNNKYSFAEHVKNREFLAFIFFERYSLDKALENKLLGATYSNSNSRLASLAEKAKKIFACLGGSSSYHKRIFSFCLREAVREKFDDESFYDEDKKLSYDDYKTEATVFFYEKLINYCKDYALFTLDKDEQTLIHGCKITCSKEAFKFYFKHRFSYEEDVYSFSNTSFDNLAHLLDKQHRENLFYATLLSFCEVDLDYYLTQLEREYSNEDSDKSFYKYLNHKEIAERLYLVEFKVRLVTAFSDALRKKINFLADDNI